MAIQTGSVGGRFMARRRPVTTALKSEIVELRFISFRAKYSKRTHETTEVIINIAALMPKNQIPPMAAGIRAIITSSINFEW